MAAFPSVQNPFVSCERLSCFADCLPACSRMLAHLATYFSLQCASFISCHLSFGKARDRSDAPQRRRRRAQNQHLPGTLAGVSPLRTRTQLTLLGLLVSDPGLWSLSSSRPPIQRCGRCVPFGEVRAEVHLHVGPARPSLRAHARLALPRAGRFRPLCCLSSALRCCCCLVCLPLAACGHCFAAMRGCHSAFEAGCRPIQCPLRILLCLTHDYRPRWLVWAATSSF